MQRKDLVIGHEYYIRPSEKKYGAKTLATFTGERKRYPTTSLKDSYLVFVQVPEDGKPEGKEYRLRNARSVVGPKEAVAAQIAADRAAAQYQQAQVEKAQQAADAARDILALATGLPFKVSNYATRITLDLTPEVLARLLGE